METKNDIKINETHICVLRRNSNTKKVFVDYMTLCYPHMEKLNKLQAMCNNSQYSVLDMQRYVENSELKELTHGFDFCLYLSGAYQSCPPVEFIKGEDYRSKLAEYDERIRNAQTDDEADEVKRYKANYVKTARGKFYDNIKSHVVPYLLAEQYAKLSSDNSVLAFSHRRVGWSNPEFTLRDDLKVVYKTNFGYGSASYFFTNITYKGISILPYSDWIVYRRAATADIIRYTRRHRLLNEEWKGTMEFTEKMYNSSLTNPQSFVQDWIISEVAKMVEGLESLLNEEEKTVVIDSYFHQDTRIAITGHDLIRYKGEKLSGALDFLDKLKVLISIYSDINFYIKRIMKCNMSIYPQLVQEIAWNKEEEKKYQDQLEEILVEWRPMAYKNNQYQAKRALIENEVAAEPGFVNEIYKIKREADNRFNAQYPEYADFYRLFMDVDDRKRKVERIIRMIQAAIKELTNYVQKIKQHLPEVETIKVA